MTEIAKEMARNVKLLVSSPLASFSSCSSLYYFWYIFSPSTAAKHTPKISKDINAVNILLAKRMSGLIPRFYQRISVGGGACET